VEIARDSLPGQQDQRAGEGNKHDRREDAEGGPCSPQWIEGEAESEQHGNCHDRPADGGKVDGGERRQGQQHADHHGRHQRRRRGELGVPVKAYEPDDRQPDEGVDAPG